MPSPTRLHVSRVGWLAGAAARRSAGRAFGGLAADRARYGAVVGAGGSVGQIHHAAAGVIPAASGGQRPGSPARLLPGRQRHAPGRRGLGRRAGRRAQRAAALDRRLGARRRHGAANSSRRAAPPDASRPAASERARGGRRRRRHRLCCCTGATRTLAKPRPAPPRSPRRSSRSSTPNRWTRR